MIDKIKRFFAKPLSIDDITPDANKQMVTEALKELNCEVEWTHEKSGVWFVQYDFQRGHFGIHLFPGTKMIELTYLYIADTDLANVHLVRQLCNEMNINSDGPRFCYTLNEAKNNVDIHLFFDLLLDSDRAKDILSTAMSNLFGSQNAFCQRLDTVEKEAKENETDDLEAAKSDVERSCYMIREQELTHQKIAPGWRQNDNKPASLTQWMDVAFGMANFVPSELTIVTNEIHHLADRQAIEVFDLSTPLIEGGKFVRQHAMLDLIFFLPSAPDTRQRMTISLQQVGKAKDILYYRITGTLLPLPATPSRSLSSVETNVRMGSALIAYDLRTDKQLNDEFIYTWKEAQSKLANSQEGELTDEECLLATVLLQPVASYLYRGRRLYLQKRYVEAIPHLFNAFYRLFYDFTTLNNSAKETFLEICFMLGSCHMEMLQYDRAFFFLSFTVGRNNIRYAETYINCLVNMNDFRALATIEDMLNDVYNSLRDIEDDQVEEPLQDFRRFLLRRKSYVLIGLQRLNEAEKLLREMLKNQEDMEYAKQELAYIQYLRTANQNEKKASDTSQGAPI